MSPAPALEFSALTCRRGGRTVFRNLDLALAPGTCLLLTGANGTGKSSLLRVLAGLTPPVAGSIRIDGAAAEFADQRGLVAYLGHADAIKPVLTVAEQLGADAAPALAAMGLAELAELPGRYLSAGQRRRTAFARVLTSGRPVWLLDEPTVGLDEASVAAAVQAIAGHCAAGGIAVAATHLPLAVAGARTLRLGEPQ